MRKIKAKHLTTAYAVNRVIQLDLFLSAKPNLIKKTANINYSGQPICVYP